MSTASPQLEIMLRNCFVPNAIVALLNFYLTNFWKPSVDTGLACLPVCERSTQGSNVHVLYLLTYITFNVTIAHKSTNDCLWNNLANIRGKVCAFRITIMSNTVDKWNHLWINIVDLLRDFEPQRNKRKT